MKKLGSLINSIDYQSLEFFSYLLIIVWAVSPIVEYILKFYIKSLYTSYFVFAIYFIGIFGILSYGVYLYKEVIENKFCVKKIIPQILLLILVIMGIVSSIFSFNPNLSFFGGSFHKEGLIVYVMYVGFILAASIIRDRKYIKKVFKVIIISALFITIMPLFRSDFSYRHFSNIYVWFNHYGYFLMISVMSAGFMFVVRSNFKRIIYLFAYIFLLYMLVLNDTFGCFLAAVISLVFALIYSLIKKYKRVEVIILVIIFVMISFLVSTYDIKFGERVSHWDSRGIVLNNVLSFSNDVKKVVSNDSSANLGKIGTGRGLLWKEAFNYTLENPLIGGGMECLGPYYSAKDIHYADRPHNIILQVSSFIGIPGAIIYITLILYLAFGNLKNLNKDTVNFMVYVTAMCYFISSNFGNTMYYTSPYFMILLGFLISMKNNKGIKS